MAVGKRSKWPSKLSPQRLGGTVGEETGTQEIELTLQCKGRLFATTRQANLYTLSIYVNKDAFSRKHK